MAGRRADLRVERHESRLPVDWGSWRQLGRCFGPDDEGLSCLAKHSAFYSVGNRVLLMVSKEGSREI